MCAYGSIPGGEYWVERQRKCEEEVEVELCCMLEENVSEKLEFLKSLVEAFQTGMHIGVKLITNDGRLSIHAHRVVMATKSPVLRAIFESDEMKELYVDIQELSHDQLRYLLEFLYCAQILVDALAKHGPVVLIAADKYDIPIIIIEQGL